MTEFRLFDDPGADVAEIITDGATMKPFVNIITQFVREARLHVSEHGLSVRAADRENVAACEVKLDAAAFESFEVSDETTLGVNLNEFKRLIRRARKGHDDTLTLSLNQYELSATVARGYADHNVVSQGTLGLIDPASVREEPDIPELDRSVEITLPHGPFTDALSYGVGAHDYVELAVKGVNQHTDAFYVSGESDTRAESVAVDNVTCPATAESLYDSDRLSDLLAATSEVSPKEVTLTFDDGKPLTLTAATDHLTASLMVAPRLRD